MKGSAGLCGFKFKTMKKDFLLFLRALKALKWHSLHLSCREAAYIRPLSKRFDIRLTPTYPPKKNYNPFLLETTSKPDGYRLECGRDVKKWVVENYEKLTPLKGEIVKTRISEIIAIKEEGRFLAERLIFSS